MRPLKIVFIFVSVEWLEEISEYLDDDVELNNASFDELKEVLETGKKLPSHSAVERALGQISGLITQARLGIAFEFGRPKP